MVLLILLSLALAVFAGAALKEGIEDDSSGLRFVSLILLVWSVLSAGAAYVVHEHKLHTIETREKPTIDIKVTATHDGQRDTVYIYHFPEE